MGKISFGEVVQPNGDHDCIFLKHVEPPAATTNGKAKELAPGDPVPLRRKVCSVYPVRPLQCRTWPFWPENLSSEKAWDHAAKRCHGMNAPGRTFSINQIHSIRDAAEWPKKPPTSAQPSPAAQPKKK